MKNIGVFFGSGSPEHDISIITAQLVIAGLKGLDYKVIPVYITKQGQWMLGEDLGNIKMFTDPKKKVEDYKNFGSYYLDMEESIGKMVFKKKGLSKKTINIDLAFPALHGSFGEDGTIQGLFEIFGIPYVGCGVTASAISMDKALTKEIYEQHKIPTSKFLYFYKKDWEAGLGITLGAGCGKTAILNKINQELKWPLFVKPVHLGSSIAVAKVKNKDVKDLEHRLEVAFHFDSKVIVEESVENLMDVTCCVIGNDKPKVSLLQESLFIADVLDFENKYLKGGGVQTGEAKESLVIPARLNEQTTKEIQNMALRVYKVLECSGIARMDFLYNKETKNFYTNEINPLPGTLYHHLWEASGIKLDQLLVELIQYAEEKHEEKKEINYTFKSSVLSNSQLGKLGSKKLE